MNEFEIGNIIKVNRLNQNLTLRKLAEKTGVPYSTLSKIECGKVSVSVETIKKIEEGLSIEIKDNFELNNEIQVMFKRFIDGFIAKNQINDYKTLLEDDYKYLSSEKYYLILLIKYIVSIKMKALDLVAEYGHLLDFLNLNDSYAEQLILDFKGYSLYQKSEYKDALNFYKLALNKYYDEKNHALIYYHMSEVCKVNNQILDMIEYLNKAKKLFSISHLYFRSLICDVNIAIVYSRMGNTCKAIEIYDECLEVLNQISDNKELKAKIMRNKAWTLLKSRKYEAALQTLKQSNLLVSNNHYTILYSVWCYYQIGNIEEAKLWLKKGRKYISSEIKEFSFLDLFVSTDAGKREMDHLIQEGMDLLSVLKIENDQDVIQFYKRIICDLYVKNDDYKNAYLLMNQ